eukprot:12877089-Ditylum_brightwellii.AAC.1
MVIVDCDCIDPFLFPLARRDVSMQGSRTIVQLGEKAVDFDEHSFRMIFVSRNPEPNLDHDARALVTIVNFTVTKGALESLLLSNILQVENSDLMEQQKRLSHEEERSRAEL